MALAAAFPGAATAEVLTIEGIYAARDPGAIEVEEIVVERFGGEIGEQLALALTDRLEAIALDGQPYFGLRAATGGGDRVYVYGADTPAGGNSPMERAGPVTATLRGTASSEVTETLSGTTKQTRCLRKNEKGKCVEKTIDVYECRELTVSLAPELRLVAAERGTLYAARDRLSRSVRFCGNDSSIPSALPMMEELIDRFATRVRLDLAPQFRREDVRVLESRKGLAKGDSAAFKQAVKLTKNDQLAACLRFNELAERNPGQASAVFNAGLCSERDGRLEEAAAKYRRALATGEGEAYSRAGLERVASRLEAEQQLELRYPPAEPDTDEAL